MPRLKARVRFPGFMSKGKIILKYVELARKIEEILASREITKAVREVEAEAEAPWYSAELVVFDPRQARTTASPPEAGEVRETVRAVAVPGAQAGVDPLKISVNAVALPGEQITLQGPRLTVEVTLA